MPLLRPRPTIGLDIGSRVVRAVALRRSSDGWSLVAAGAIERNGTGTDARAVVQQLLGTLSVRRAPVAVAVPAHSAIVRRLRLPAHGHSDLDRQVALEAEDHLPFAIDDAVLSYQVLERGKDELAVLLSAARRSEVAERLSFVSDRGRRVGVADVEGLAVANAFSLNYPDQSDSALLVHTGHRSGVLCLIERGELTGTRGFTLDATGIDGHSLADIRQMAASANPQHVLLSGGRWDQDGLSARLSAALGRSIDTFDPIRRIRSSSSTKGAEIVGPAFAVAVGLGLRRKGDW